MTTKNSDDKTANQQPSKRTGEHLRNYQFVKGQSGNPTGRPKGSSGILTELRKSLDKTKLLGKNLPEGKTARELIGEAILWHVIKGNAGYLARMLEYIYGKPAIRIEQKTTGDAGGQEHNPEAVAAAMKAYFQALGEPTGPDE
jgi:hypothetical protein